MCVSARMLMQVWLVAYVAASSMLGAACSGSSGLPLLDDAHPVPPATIERAIPELRTWAPGRAADESALDLLAAALPAGAPRAPEVPTADPPAPAPAAFVVATRDGVWIADVDVGLAPRSLRRVATLSNGVLAARSRRPGATVGIPALGRALTARVHALTALWSAAAVDPSFTLALFADRDVPFTLLFDIAFEAIQSGLRDVRARVNAAGRSGGFTFDLPRATGRVVVLPFWIGAREVVLDSGSEACDAAGSRPCRRSAQPCGPSACAALGETPADGEPLDPRTPLAVLAAPGVTLGDAIAAIVQCRHAPAMVTRPVTLAIGDEPACIAGHISCEPRPRARAPGADAADLLENALDPSSPLRGATGVAPGVGSAAPR